jgi:hypothetical protein
VLSGVPAAFALPTVANAAAAPSKPASLLSIVLSKGCFRRHAPQNTNGRGERLFPRSELQDSGLALQRTRHFNEDWNVSLSNERLFLFQERLKEFSLDRERYQLLDIGKR